MSLMPTSKQLPKDALVVLAILKEMGVTAHEPRVVNQLLDFIYKYVVNVVEEAKVYSQYAKKKTIDVDDVKFAIKVVSERSFVTVPPREMLMDLAKTKNTTPLPLIRSTSGLRLPPDRHCLTQPNYRLQFQKKTGPSSSSVTTPKSGGASSSASSLFKTPSSYPTKGTGEPDSKKAKRDY